MSFIALLVTSYNRPGNLSIPAISNQAFVRHQRANTRDKTEVLCLVATIAVPRRAINSMLSTHLTIGSRIPEL